MKSSLVQPSLSRDFAILTGVILFVLLLLSLWITWSTHAEQSQAIVSQLEKETDRIDRTLDREIHNASYLLDAIGQQIRAMPTPGKRDIAKILQTYQSHNRVYAIWAWADKSKSVVVSSNMGVLEEPVDISDRDYIKQTSIEPWKFQIGVPIQGRVSERWVIPVSLGVTDEAGNYLGSITASLDIQEITNEISHLVKRPGISFAITSKTMVKLTEVSDQPNFTDTYFPEATLKRIEGNKDTKGVVSYASLFATDGIYAYYKLSERFPYILLVGYDTAQSQKALQVNLLPRLLQIISIAAFALLFLWIVRVRIIHPVMDLTDEAAGITHGDAYAMSNRKAPMEIEALAIQLSRISDYIDERKRVETELREKLEVELTKQQNKSVENQHFTEE